MEYLEDGKLRLQFSPIPEVWDDYAVFLSYGSPLSCLVIVHLFVQNVCLNISGVL